MKFMRDAFFHEFFMQIAVDLIEEIFCSAVYDQIQLTRLDQVSHVDYCVLFPVFRVFLI